MHAIITYKSKAIQRFACYFSIIQVFYIHMYNRYNIEETVLKKNPK